MNKIEFESKEKIKKSEEIIKKILKALGFISVLTTLGIVFSLFEETILFFKDISIKEFLTGREWTPLFQPPKFGVLPLVVGTLLIVVISSIISIPVGLGSAIYLSEYAPKKIRKILKPVLEILAGIPSIVYGYFALTAITPIIKIIFPQTSVYNALSAGIAVGIMTIPLVSSLSEDAMMSVPDSLRFGAYALGATKYEVIKDIVIPTAFPTIVASFILAISRAVGETMIVAMAAGSTPKMTLNPLESIQTMTGYIVQISMGDIPYGSIGYRTLFAVGSLLFLITFTLNLISRYVIRRHRRLY
ncbi:phosphate ABC transporter membrane protein 1, PhoT family (TC 3.A.1.7.1) [Caloramator fervidus]|uniref:Phosphate transport system permease protein n=1 Tax=Caloramator fervidus TaxID=29344 RepID=A0A1H5XIF5_9CLOT|nr:phosphate ABC transporter permease subunit PstC [Caloramator fervidus]SEG11531.1 phosphate ABC transporter membrane protein 1, PhoT family (TC 3.A.1.7.1) [Caloramator fervidus]